MANLPITGLPEAITEVSGNDRLVVAKEISPGVFETQQTPAENIYSKNYLNANLINSTGNRSHDHGEYDMLWGKIKTFTAQATIAPTGSNASFNWRGYGTSSSDLQIQESSQLGVIREAYGDQSQKFFGDTVIEIGKKVVFNSTLGYIEKSTGSNGVAIIGNDGVLYVGWNGGQLRHDPGTEVDTLDTYGSGSSGYFRQNGSGSAWRYGRNGSNGSIMGYVTTLSDFVELVSMKSDDGTWVHKTRTFIDESGAGTMDDSATFQVDSTEKGLLIPRMTEAQMNAISDPANGLEVFNTTRQSKMFYHSFFGWSPNSVIENSWWGYSFFTEATGNSGDTWATSFLNGGTAVISNSATLSPTALFGLSTGTNTNGESQIRTGLYWRVSVGKKQTETKASFSALSTVTDRYVFTFGYLSATNGYDQANGVYFLYDEGGLSAGGSASANWQCVCVNSSTRTFVTTSVAVSTTSMQKLRIDDDGTGANVKFYIDEVLVATITTNVPTGSTVTTFHAARITKTTGTTNKNAFIDCLYMKEKFNTTR